MYKMYICDQPNLLDFVLQIHAALFGSIYNSFIT